MALFYLYFLSWVILYSCATSETFMLFPCLGYCEQCCNEHRALCIFFELYFWLDICPGVRLLDDMVLLLLILFSMLFSIVAAPVYIPINSIQGFPFLHTLSRISHFSCVWLFVTLWTVCSPLRLSVHRILQARILEWVAISFSRGSTWPRDRTSISYVSCIVLYHTRLF